MNKNYWRRPAAGCYLPTEAADKDTNSKDSIKQENNTKANIGNHEGSQGSHESPTRIQQAHGPLRLSMRASISKCTPEAWRAALLHLFGCAFAESTCKIHAGIHVRLLQGEEQAKTAKLEHIEMHPVLSNAIFTSLGVVHKELCSIWVLVMTSTTIRQ